MKKTTSHLQKMNQETMKKIRIISAVILVLSVLFNIWFLFTPVFPGSYGSKFVFQGDIVVVNSRYTGTYQADLEKVAVFIDNDYIILERESVFQLKSDGHSYKNEWALFVEILLSGISIVSAIALIKTQYKIKKLHTPNEQNHEKPISPPENNQNRLG